MRTSLDALNAIKEFEGLRLQAYKCPAGVWTIGYGHTDGVTEGMEITERQATALLKADLISVEKAVNELGVCKTQGQFDALVDFAFNLGIEALKGSTLLKCIRRGESEDEIGRQFRRWIYSKGKIQPGLQIRRAWEVARYRM
jgi:lysozyme